MVLEIDNFELSSDVDVSLSSVLEGIVDKYQQQLPDSVRVTHNISVCKLLSQIDSYLGMLC